MLNLDRYNQRIEEATGDLVKDIKAVGAGMGITHRANSPSKAASLPKVSGKTYQRDGMTEKISIRFPRQLIYTHKGAGKGRGGSQGSRWIDRMGNKRSTDPQSLGKMGTDGRTAKPFINQAIEAKADTIATIAAEEIGSSITNNLFIK